MRKLFEIEEYHSHGKNARSNPSIIRDLNCPNAKTIIRHWDVNGKECPKPMVGEDNKMWKAFKKAIQ